MNETVEKIIKETTDTEKVELFIKLAEYITENVTDGNIKDYTEFFDSVGKVVADIHKFTIGTHKKADFWK